MYIVIPLKSGINDRNNIGHCEAVYRIRHMGISIFFIYIAHISMFCGSQENQYLFKVVEKTLACNTVGPNSCRKWIV